VHEYLATYVAHSKYLKTLKLENLALCDIKIQEAWANAIKENSSIRGLKVKNFPHIYEFGH
jgi:hypothetical protein